MRFETLSDEEWPCIEPLPSSNAGRKEHPFGDNCRVVEASSTATGPEVPWRDLPREVFGPWQTV